MSLLPEDADVEFGLHETYANEGDMDFPNDFGAEEIASELNVPADMMSSSVEMVTEDHHFEVAMHETCSVKEEEVQDSELMIQSAGEEQQQQQQQQQHYSDPHQQYDATDSTHIQDGYEEVEEEEPDAEELDAGEPDGDEDDEQEQEQHTFGERAESPDGSQQKVETRREMLDESLQSNAMEQGKEQQQQQQQQQYANDDEDDEYENNLLEPLVDLVEEDQPIHPKVEDSFRIKSSGQPNVVRRFQNGSVRQPMGHNSYKNCSNGFSSAGEEEDDEDDEYDAPVGKDDRRGCRSLVCDSNSIIIAEMVYRCLICAHVTESIGEAQKHYHRKHMKKEKCKKDQNLNPKSKAPRKQMTQTSAKNQVSEEYSDARIDESIDQLEEPDFSGGEESDNFSGSGLQPTVTFNVPAGLKQLQQTLTPDLPDDSTSPDNKNSLSGTSKKQGNFVYSPSPADYVPGRNAHKAQTAQTSSNNCTRGGYVTCAVCNITKYYASVQRRYGQFTCMGCAKFFGRFLMKPRRYCCPNLGSCPLDVSPRCKACLLLACINTYNIDDKRMKIVNANRPLKRSGQASAPRSQVLSSINSQQQSSANHSSQNFTPPPLVKAPTTQPQSMSLNRSSQQSRTNVQFEEPQSANLPNTRQQRTQRHPVSGQSQVATRSVYHMGSGGTASVTASSGSGGSSSSAQNSGRKGTGCRQCSNCLSDDCGVCNYCLDKPKFGGPNTLKKKCINKKCLLVQPNANQRIRLIRK